MKLIAWGFLFASALAYAGGSEFDKSGAGISQVMGQIYRGPRPTLNDLNDLKDRGVHAVIDLEDETGAVATERQYAQRLGLGWVNEPMNYAQTPNDAEVNQILTMMQDPRYLPVFVHCHHGQDRSGLIIGLYRVLVQRWAPAQAYQEMLQFGFHAEYKALDNYFRAKTGYRGP